MAPPPQSSTNEVDPIQLTIPLTLTPHTSIQALIQHRLQTPLIFLTTSTTHSSPSQSALGSFVYALPNRLNPSESLCTTLYAQQGTLDFATRVAKIVAKRIARPVYVGWSGELGGIGRQVDEEMEGVRKVVEGIMGVFEGQNEEARG